MKNANQALTEHESFLLLHQIRTAGHTTKQKQKALRNYTIAVLMLDASLRVGEVTRLFITDLIFNTQPVSAIIVRAHIAKGNTERTIPVTLRIQFTLEEMYQKWWSRSIFGTGCPAFCQRNTSRTMTTRQVERIIRVAGIKAINRPIHPHQLRHTFATRLMKKTNIRVVQELLGHKCLASTQVYTHPQNEDLQPAIRNIEAEEQGKEPSPETQLP